MYRLHRVGPAPGRLRLEADQLLEPKDFQALANEIGSPGLTARKVGFVAARVALAREPVETYWNGRETRAVAERGDYVVANLAPDRSVLRDRDGNPNLYVITAARFPNLYVRDQGETEHGEIYRPIGTVEAIFLPGGFDILGPWGERQIADAGYLLLNGPDVYGNNLETFERTYQIL